MPDSASPVFARKIIFQTEKRTFDLQDVIDAAHFRGELQPLWEHFLKIVAAEDQAGIDDLDIVDEAVDAAAERFRYRFDLITAEETERWLAERGLDLEKFSDHFVQCHWIDFVEAEAHPPLDYLAAPDALRASFAIGLLLSGESICLAQELAKRLALIASHPTLERDDDAARTHFLKTHRLAENQVAPWTQKMGRPSTWIEEMLELEAVFAANLRKLLTPAARAREISGLRLPLTGFEVETIEFDSEDAAREGALCVREDGLSMEEVAAEGRYAYRCEKMFFEDLPEVFQGRFLSANDGDLLTPIARGEGFHLWRILKKTEPDLADSIVRERADSRILERYFTEITAKTIRWSQLSAAESRRE